MWMSTISFCKNCSTEFKIGRIIDKKYQYSERKNSFEPDSNQRPMDYCDVYRYSPPLYQLSYRRRQYKQPLYKLCNARKHAESVKTNIICWPTSFSVSNYIRFKTSKNIYILIAFSLTVHNMETSNQSK